MRYLSAFGPALGCCIALALIGFGCASAGSFGREPVRRVEPGEVTEIRGPLEVSDILSCADKLARDLLNTPEINRVAPRTIDGEDSRPRIALREIVNATNDRRFASLDTNIILDLMLNHLTNNYGEKLAFVQASRGGEYAERPSSVIVERELQQEGVYDTANPGPLAGYQFEISGTIRSMTVGTNKGLDDSIFISVSLVDLRSMVIWNRLYGPIRTVTRIPRS